MLRLLIPFEHGGKWETSPGNGKQGAGTGEKMKQEMGKGGLVARPLLA